MSTTHCRGEGQSGRPHPTRGTKEFPSPFPSFPHPPHLSPSEPIRHTETRHTGHREGNNNTLNKTKKKLEHKTTKKVKKKQWFTSTTLSDKDLALHYLSPIVYHHLHHHNTIADTTVPYTPQKTVRPHATSTPPSILLQTRSPTETKAESLIPRERVKPPPSILDQRLKKTSKTRLGREILCESGSRLSHRQPSLHFYQLGHYEWRHDGLAPIRALAYLHFLAEKVGERGRWGEERIGTVCGGEKKGGR